MATKGHRRHGFEALAFIVLALAAVFAAPGTARSDEGGVGFWLPGLFGSLAALPGEPGWAFTSLYYHTSVATTGKKEFPLGGRIVAGLSGGGNLAAFGPTYVFATPVLGAQASLSLLGLGGRNEAGISASLTGPRGRTISSSLSQSITDFGDVIPQGQLKWNRGVNNWMTYLTGDVPIGAYDATRLANLGLGHGAIDGGGGYTYFNPQTGREFSTTIGLTYNFPNQTLQYQNGLDFHLDWGASQFLSKQVFVGLVGYLYNQVTPDTGVGASLGAFESRVAGIGPQIGYSFPIGHMQGFLGLKGYGEFAAQNRAHGWNLWLTFAISPAPAAHAAAAICD